MTPGSKLATLATLAALGCSLITLSAHARDKELPPEGGAPKAFDAPKMITYRLANGVGVTLVPHGRVPKVTVRVVVRAGNHDDGDHPLIANLAAAMMREGADGHDASAIARKAAAMGGELGVEVDRNETTVTMNVLSESAPLAVSLLADVVQRPNLAQSSFDRVKQNELRLLSLSAARPRKIAEDAFLRTIYPDHPYSRAVLPDPAALEKLTLADVRDFHAASFVGQNTHIYVVGQFSAADIRRAIAGKFERWVRGTAKPSRPPALPAAPAIILVDRPGAVQSNIRLGKRVPPIGPGVDLDTANMLLGGYFSSRIVLNIREDKGYAYTPNSRLVADRGAAYWVQNADVTSAVTGPALTEIIAEVRRLSEAPPSPGELRAVKNYMIGSFVLQAASPQGLASQLAFIDLHGLGGDYLKNYVPSVEALSAKAVQAATLQNLPVDDMSFTVVGDLSAIRAQLEAVPWLKGRLPLPAN